MLYSDRARIYSIGRKTIATFMQPQSRSNELPLPFECIYIQWFKCSIVLPWPHNIDLIRVCGWNKCSTSRCEVICYAEERACHPPPYSVKEIEARAVYGKIDGSWVLKWLADRHQENRLFFLVLSGTAGAAGLCADRRCIGRHCCMIAVWLF